MRLTIDLTTQHGTRCDYVDIALARLIGDMRFNRGLFHSGEVFQFVVNDAFEGDDTIVTIKCEYSNDEDWGDVVARDALLSRK